MILLSGPLVEGSLEVDYKEWKKGVEGISVASVCLRTKSNELIVLRQEIIVHGKVHVAGQAYPCKTKFT